MVLSRLQFFVAQKCDLTSGVVNSELARCAATFDPRLARLLAEDGKAFAEEQGNRVVQSFAADLLSELEAEHGPT